MVLEARVQSSITRHAWNRDCSLLAVVPNDNTVVIMKKPATADGAWERVAVLNEHDALVTDVAWAPNTNRIVTTSQDRNAYVWTQQPSGEWKPMLVILRISAAATRVEWSPDEQKFAVGSGAKVVPVCYYEEGNNFWVSKMIKEGQRSTVLSVTWHPSMPLLATACTDYKVRIFSSYLKHLDGKCATPWGAAAKFGTLLYEWEAHGWVLDVCFSPLGDALALSAQNSTVSFVDLASAAAATATSPTAAEAPLTLRLSELPLSQLLFLPTGTLVGAGHGMEPILFEKVDGGWRQRGVMHGAKKAEGAEAGSIAATRRMFQAQVSTGRGESAASAARLDSAHQFAICGLSNFHSNLGSAVVEFTSSALDGKIAFWTQEDLASAG